MSVLVILFLLLCTMASPVVLVVANRFTDLRRKIDHLYLVLFLNGIVLLGIIIQSILAGITTLGIVNLILFSAYSAMVFLLIKQTKLQLRLKETVEEMLKFVEELDEKIKKQSKAVDPSAN